jgi:hypothetical protein
MAATMTRLDEIREQLAPDQLAFLAERVLCRTDKEAAANLGYSYSTVLSWSQKAIINEAVKLILADGVDVAREILRRGLTDAARVKVDGLKARGMGTKQAAATEILDRFLGKPTQQSNINVSGGPLTINLTWGDTEAERDGADNSAS